MTTKPHISERTFWDIDPDTLDFEEAADWVILRVFDKGSLEEVLSVVRLYGAERVKQLLTQEKSYLPNHTILLAKALFRLSFHDFACLEEKPFQTRLPRS